MILLVAFSIRIVVNYVDEDPQIAFTLPRLSIIFTMSFMGVVLNYGLFYVLFKKLRHRIVGKYRDTNRIVALWFQTCQPSRFWRDSPVFLPDVPRPAKSWKCPAFCTKLDFFCAHFVTLPWCPDVNANRPIERNYGNSVRFLAKIPNGTAAESPCYSVFWNAIDFCRLYTSKKNLNVGPANRHAFCRQVTLFLREMSL